MMEKNLTVIDDYGNSITQNVLVRTAQIRGNVYDRRTEQTIEMNTFMIVPEDRDWKAEYNRILKGLGFEDAGIIDEVFRETWQGAGALFIAGK